MRPEELLALQHEIRTGQLDSVVNRFKPHFLAEVYPTVERDIKHSVHEARKAHFLQWIAGGAPSAGLAVV